MPLNIRHVSRADGSRSLGPPRADRETSVAVSLSGSPLSGGWWRLLSGKGGVGKSFVTAGLARALAALRAPPTGVLDAGLQTGQTPLPNLLPPPPPTSCTLHDDVIEPLVSAEGRSLLLDGISRRGRFARWRFRGPDNGGLRVGAARSRQRRCASSWPTWLGAPSMSCWWISPPGVQRLPGAHRAVLPAPTRRAGP